VRKGRAFGAVGTRHDKQPIGRPEGGGEGANADYPNCSFKALELEYYGFTGLYRTFS
jgi:hypothetical protein